jgi:hypothetical protein
LPHQLPIPYTEEGAFTCPYKIYFKKAYIAIYIYIYIHKYI